MQLVAHSAAATSDADQSQLVPRDDALARKRKQDAADPGHDPQHKSNWVAMHFKKLCDDTQDIKKELFKDINQWAKDLPGV